MREILIETSTVFRLQPNQLNENLSRNKSGNLILDNILLSTCERKNGNNRYYPRPIWERELDKYIKEKININNALNELDHPDSNIINLKNVSHAVRKAWWDGDKIMGQLEILPTPSGNILKTLIESGVTIGFSTRGLGSLKQMDDVMEVQDDFDLIALCDAVSTPSNPGSWANHSNILKEGLDKGINPYSKINGIITDILCSQGNCPLW